jgi:peptide/nickel transport system permease protein
MVGFVIRRLLVSVLVLVASSVLVFALVANSADPLGDLLGRHPPPSAASVLERRKQLNLVSSSCDPATGAHCQSNSVLTRYGIWASGFIHGDFGKSIARNDDVGHELWQRLVVTLRMVILAALLAILLAIVVGVVSAVRQYSWVDNTATFFGFLFLSTPVFWLAALLKIYAGIKLNNLFGHRWIYTIGEQSSNLSGSLAHRWGDYLGHLVLPTIALTLITYAAWSRYQRAAMLDVLNSDYVRLARAKGVPRAKVMVKHALRNALIPLTTVVAIDFGSLFGGAVITETVFNWQGMGKFLIDGVNDSDVNVVLAWLMISAVIIVLFNLLADVLYAFLDPRIRFG